MRRLRVMVALVLVTAISPVVAAAQGGASSRRVIDRILAIVGVRPVLQSQVDERIVMMQAQGQTVPEDSAARAEITRQIVQDMIDEELLVQQAERDTSVRVPEQEVQAQVEQTATNVRNQFSSEDEFQAETRRAGFASVEEWRRYLTENQRRTVLGQRLIEHLRSSGKLRPIPPTDQEVKEFWEANQASLPPRTASASFRQLIVVPKADSASRARAFKLADSLATALRAGADFGTLATRFTDDTSTRAGGGELGWFRRGMMVPAFETAAFSQRPGEISPPIETTYGFHVIRVDRAQPGEVLAHHILITPDVSPQQVDAARRLADSLYVLLAKGASFDSLARRSHDPNEPKLAEAIPIDSLPEEYRKMLNADTTVGLKPVIAVGQGSAKPQFVILEITARIPAGPMRFEDIKGRIRDRLGADIALRNYIAQLRRQSYIDLRMP